jgi:hypothetical protein
MSSVLETHNKAMDLAEEAAVEQRHANAERAADLLRQAFECEKLAAEMLATNLEAEPTRSVLYRSAASLAVDCKEFREAERLIATALLGNPPYEIAEELRDLLEQVHFERHLKIHDVELGPSDIQMSLAGSVVGYGIILTEAFVERVQQVQKLIFRTVERKLARPFREQGQATRSVRQPYTLYNTAPRPGSFIMTFRLGQPQQSTLPGLEDTEGVVDEFMICLELFNRSEEDSLRQRFSDEAYYRNFVGLARKIAPDGERVNFVGLSTMQNGAERAVALTTPSEQITLTGQLVQAEDEGKPVVITGTLKAANAIGTNRISLVDEHNKRHRIIVPEGMMSDIVKPLWEDTVTVIGTKKGKDIQLNDIRPAG